VLDYDKTAQDTLVKSVIDYGTVQSDGKRIFEAPEGPRTVETEVQERMTYLYNYGIKMLVNGIIAEEDVKTIVLGRMAARVRMDGAVFDRWLGMEKVQ